uniref:Uncharacterized protein n=1 Tax=Anguilla anguilla TaxID=7936 RepID=A0A0E9XDY5_ANGAN
MAHMFLCIGCLPMHICGVFTFSPLPCSPFQM